MRTRYEYKAMAKNILNGKYSLCILVIVIIAAISGFINFIIKMAIEIPTRLLVGINIGNLRHLNFKLDNIFDNKGNILTHIPLFVAIYIITYFVSLLVQSILASGQKKFYLNIVNGNQYELKNIFYTVNHHWFRFLIYNFILGIINFIIFIPMAIFVGLIALFINNPHSLIILAIFLVIFCLLAVILSMVVLLMYSMGVYIMLEDDSIGALAALKISRNMVSGYKSELFNMYLSFLGMIILAFLSLGIGMLWVRPYIQTTIIILYSDLKQQQVAI